MSKTTATESHLGYGITLDIPRAFYDDHTSRECGQSGEVLKTLSKTYRVALDLEAFSDLFSDADYYSDIVREAGAEYLGLQASARATVERLKRALTVCPRFAARYRYLKATEAFHAKVRTHSLAQERGDAERIGRAHRALMAAHEERMAAIEEVERVINFDDLIKEGSSS